MGHSFHGDWPKVEAYSFSPQGFNFRSNSIKPCNNNVRPVEIMCSKFQVDRTGNKITRALKPAFNLLNILLAQTSVNNMITPDISEYQP